MLDTLPSDLICHDIAPRLPFWAQAAMFSTCRTLRALRPKAKPVPPPHQEAANGYKAWCRALGFAGDWATICANVHCLNMRHVGYGAVLADREDLFALCGSFLHGTDKAHVWAARRVAESGWTLDSKCVPETVSLNEYRTTTRHKWSMAVRTRGAFIRGHYDDWSSELEYAFKHATPHDVLLQIAEAAQNDARGLGMERATEIYPCKLICDMVARWPKMLDDTCVNHPELFAVGVLGPLRQAGNKPPPSPINFAKSAIHFGHEAAAQYCKSLSQDELTKLTEWAWQFGYYSGVRLLLEEFGVAPTLPQLSTDFVIQGLAAAGTKPEDVRWAHARFAEASSSCGNCIGFAQIYGVPAWYKVKLPDEIALALVETATAGIKDSSALWLRNPVAHARAVELQLVRDDPAVYLEQCDRFDGWQCARLGGYFEQAVSDPTARTVVTKFLHIYDSCPAILAALVEYGFSAPNNAQFLALPEVQAFALDVFAAAVSNDLPQLAKKIAQVVPLDRTTVLARLIGDRLVDAAQKQGLVVLQANF